MREDEIIEKITAYAVAGKLDGMAIDVPFGSVFLRMENINVVNGTLYFDQYRSSDNEEWSRTGRNFRLNEHVKSYLQSVLDKIQELVQVDKNLFQP